MTEIRPYIPQFFWRFWLSDADPLKHTLDDHRVHIYDVYNNILSETRRIPEQCQTIFQDFDIGGLEEGCRTAHRTAERAFTRLEADAESVLGDLIAKIRDFPPKTGVPRQELSLSRRCRDTLLKFFTFLRYRNSDIYRTTLESLSRRLGTDNGAMVNAGHAWQRVRRRALLGSFHSFLQHDHSSSSVAPRFDKLDGLDCWRFCKAEICIGVASEGQQYVLPDTCFGTLDEEFGSDPTSGHLFFPVTPTISFYILGIQGDKPCLVPDCDLTSSANSAVWLECGLESPSDVHLRNANLLQCYPNHLYFSSLTSIVQSISSYDEFRWIPEHLDYSRLKQRCRQKGTLEKVTKTLVVKGSVLLVDLSEEVERVGDAPVCHGSFADVWKGVWANPTTQEVRPVALKILRRYMADTVREKLLKRLKAEVVAWHRLQHLNIAPLFGVVQCLGTIAMVSPWCNNGTIVRYLEHVNPSADRLTLLLQIASGVGYLHNFKPIVVHGDLKGSNILVGDDGQALITDFGLSNVIEDLVDPTATKLGTSLLAGSTRWMAPELILALVEDDDRSPPITTSSDVYAFASVCLEVATGHIPYPHRRNDHAVTVDIMRGVKPSRAASSLLQLSRGDDDSFWEMLNQCWDADWYLRPNMTEIIGALKALGGGCL